MLSDVRLSGADPEFEDTSTSDRVYGSHVALPAGVLALALLDDLTSAVEFGRGGPGHTCVAAFEAAGGGRFRNVVTIFAEGFSFGGFERRVFSIPPVFFSGLGVRARGSFVVGGVRFGDPGFCRLFERGMSSAESFLLLYDGLGGIGGGRLSDTGVGRGISA